jgi:N-acetyl-anhydromuramyl-L-alanine amidase AmpD
MSLTLASPPRISARQFAAVLARFHSPVAPIAFQCYDLIASYGLDPAVALAFFGKESTFGTRGRSVEWRSWGNVRQAWIPALAVDPGGVGKFATYATWQHSLKDWCARIKERYVGKGLTTVETAIPVYAPASENDTAGYINFVVSHVAAWIHEDQAMAKTIWMPSENFNPRPPGCGIEMLILHTGEGTRTSDMQALHDTSVPLEHRKSAHAYACKNGDVIEMVDDQDEAWHAGFSRWGGRVNVNPWSLGLESEHRTGDKWPDVQKQAMADWCQAKIRKYHILQKNIAAHRWIAPDRKLDPSDWGDAELRAWIAQLYTAATPAMTFYRVKTNANVRTEPNTTSRVVLVMPTGQTAGFDTETPGETVSGNSVWRHRADGLGFVWSGLTVPA